MPPKIPIAKILSAVFTWGSKIVQAVKRRREMKRRKKHIDAADKVVECNATVSGERLICRLFREHPETCTDCWYRDDRWCTEKNRIWQHHADKSMEWGKVSAPKTAGPDVEPRSFNR